MSGIVRQDEVFGHLDQRLLILENNKWETWFGKHPGVVLGAVIASLSTAFWMYHTWQIERLEKNFNTQITELKLQNKGRIDWLKEQQKERLSSQKDKCSFEKSKINNQLLQCNAITEKRNKPIKKADS